MVETVHFARALAEDFDVGIGRRQVRLQDGRVVLLNQVHAGRLLAQVDAAALPAVGNNHQLLGVTTGFGGLYADSGRIWYPLNNRTLNPEMREFGAYGDGVHDDTVAVQACIDAGKARGARVYMPGKYKISATIVFTPGRHMFSHAPLRNNTPTPTTGFIWGGGDDDVMVEIQEIFHSHFGTLQVSNATTGGVANRTGITGILMHNSNGSGAAGSRNRFDQIGCFGLKYGMRIGDQTNDGYASNTEFNEVGNFDCYGVSMPITFDSTGVDLWVFHRIQAGGPGSGYPEAREYIIKSIRLGGGTIFDSLFLRADELATDAAIIQWLGGSLTISNLCSIEGTQSGGANLMRILDYQPTASRYPSSVRGLVAPNVHRDSSDRIVLVDSTKPLHMVACNLWGNVEVTNDSVVTFEGMNFGTGYGFTGAGLALGATQVEINTSANVPAANTENGTGVLWLDNLRLVDRVVFNQAQSLSVSQDVGTTMTSGTPFTLGTWTGDAGDIFSCTADIMLYRAGVTRVLCFRGTMRYTVAISNGGEIYTHVSGAYTAWSGTHNGGNNLDTLIDTTTNFTMRGVLAGDLIKNVTDGSSGLVSVISTTTNPGDTITLNPLLSGGAQHDFDTGDVYLIIPARANGSLAVPNVVTSNKAYLSFSVVPSIASSGSGPYTILVQLTQTNTNPVSPDALWIVATLNWTATNGNQATAIDGSFIPAF